MSTSEPKPFASLSSGLLARKGAARPAMKPQGFGQMGGGNLEDLGWNDMGFEAPKPVQAPRDATHDAFGEDVVGHPRAHPTGLTPVGSPVHDQQAEIEDRLVLDDAGEDQDETAELYESDAAEPEVAEPEVIEPEATAPEAIEPDVIEPKVFALAVKPAAVVVPIPQPAAKRSFEPRAAAGSKAKAAFTLRLDPSRHLKLRLACAVDGRSAQQIVTDALDRLLANMPELDAMAEKAKRKG